ncbi:MAG: DUF1211 domain-containing protein [Bacteroidetes bacterium]|nr:DUF1211 domain-containing protein [Bacteroidota bacterium]
MTKNRTEAFSDGVLAIIITIMVLGLQLPNGDTFEALKPLIPKILSYILSFIYVGIYWNNHHHLFQAVQKVNGKILWANLVLLFFLSLVPITTAWMGENHFASHPVILYGVNLMLCAIAFIILAQTILEVEGKESKLAKAISSHYKEYTSVALYILGILIALFFKSELGALCYAVVALIWVIPDKRIEKNIADILD